MRALSFLLAFFFSVASAATAPITFTSGPTATPAIAGTGQPVVFAVAATGGKSALTYSWNLGDGGTNFLQNPTHKYLVSGTFTATVTATDGTTSASATVKILVHYPTIRTGLAYDTLDSDGDGFSDVIEQLYGTDPFNAASTPYNGLPARINTIRKLDITSASLKVSFEPKGKRSVKYKGSMSVPEGFSLVGQKVLIICGHRNAVFTVGSKGNGTNSLASLKFSKLKKAPAGKLVKKNRSLTDIPWPDPQSDPFDDFPPPPLPDDPPFDIPDPIDDFPLPPDPFEDPFEWDDLPDPPPIDISDPFLDDIFEDGFTGEFPDDPALKKQPIHLEFRMVTPFGTWEGSLNMTYSDTPGKSGTGSLGK